MLVWGRSNRSFLVVRILIGTVFFVVIVWACIARTGFASKELGNSAPLVVEKPELEPREGGNQALFSRYSVVTDMGETLALAQGDYLVAMLSMSCDHCMASVPQLNEIMEAMPEIPVVALCWEPSGGAMAEFVSMSGPLFPMHSLGDNFLEFAELIGSAPPRLSFVRNGVAVQSWDDTMPDLETLLAAVAPHRQVPDRARSRQD